MIKGILVVYALLAQQPFQEHGMTNSSNSWSQPGNAYSSSFQQLPFNQLCPILNATVTVHGWWQPGAEVNFIWTDGNGPTGLVGFKNINLEQASQEHGGTNPVAISRDVTQIFQNLQVNGVPKNIGYQVYGHMTLTSVKLEVLYDVGIC